MQKKNLFRNSICAVMIKLLECIYKFVFQIETSFSDQGNT